MKNPFSNNDILEGIFRNAKHIVLDIDARERVKKNLIIIVERDLIAHENVQAAGHGNVLYRLGMVRIPRVVRIGVPFAFVVLILVGGSVHFAAGGALPGDFLYPVKQVDEQVQRLLSRSDDMSAKAEGHFIEKRLDEIESAMYRDEVDAARGQYMAQYVADAVSQTREHMALMKEKGATPLMMAKIASELEGTLRAHQVVLIGLVGSQKNSEHVRPVTDQVERSVDDISDIRLSLHSGLSESRELELKVAAQTERDVLLESFLGTQIFFGGHAGPGDMELVSYFNDQVVKINSMILEGDDQLEKGAYGRSLTAYEQAGRMLQEADTVIKARVKYHIPLHSSQSEGPRPSISILFPSRPQREGFLLCA